MLISAPAYPRTVLSRVVPSAVAENTNKSRVSAVTGIVKPVLIPLDVAPALKIPVNAGAKVTVLPGIKIKVLSGGVD